MQPIDFDPKPMTATEIKDSKQVLASLHWNAATKRFHDQADGLYKLLVDIEISQPRQFIKNPDGTLSPRPIEEYWDPISLKTVDRLKELIEMLKQDSFKHFIALCPFCLHDPGKKSD